MMVITHDFFMYQASTSHLGSSDSMIMNVLLLCRLLMGSLGRLVYQYIHYAMQFRTYLKP